MSVTATGAAKAIRDFRKDKQLTQVQLAELINVDERALRRWENGDVKPTGENLKKLVKVVPIQDPLTSALTRLVRSNSGFALAVTLDKVLRAWSGNFLKAFPEASENFKIGERCDIIPEKIWLEQLAVAKDGHDEFLSQYSVERDGVSFLVSVQLTVTRGPTPLMVGVSSCIELGSRVNIPHTITVPPV